MDPSRCGSGSCRRRSTTGTRRSRCSGRSTWMPSPAPRSGTWRPWPTSPWTWSAVAASCRRSGRSRSGCWSAGPKRWRCGDPCSPDPTSPGHRHSRWPSRRPVAHWSPAEPPKRRPVAPWLPAKPPDRGPGMSWRAPWTRSSTRRCGTGSIRRRSGYRVREPPPTPGSARCPAPSAGSPPTPLPSPASPTSWPTGRRMRSAARSAPASGWSSPTEDGDRLAAPVRAAAGRRAEPGGRRRPDLAVPRHR